MTSRQLDSLTSFFFRQRCADEHIAGRRTITWGQARAWWRAARERARRYTIR